ncbi:MAG: DUF5057 domain-containing protein, partial [Mobilitalea sp.]
MKKYLLGAGVILIGIAIIIGWKLSDVPEQVDPTYVAATALYGTDTFVLTEDETYSEGTEQNPFVILEVIPYEGYAEIGYMIQGCEPIPMNIAAFDKAGGALIMSSTTAMTGVWLDEYTYELPSGDKVLVDLAHPVDALDPSKIAALTNLADFGKWRNAGAPEYGYYEKVAADTGAYYQETRTVDGFDAIVYVSATTENKGDYNWIPYADSSKADGSHTTTDMWDIAETLGKDRIDTYQTEYYRGKYNFSYDETHNKFLTDVLNVPYAKIADYKIKVLTITTEQLSLRTDLIDKVDLISFAPDSHYYNGTANAMVALWEKYHPGKMITTKPRSFGFNSGLRTSNDLTWEATSEILRKASVDNNIAPIIFDSKVYTADTSFTWNSGSGSNVVTPKKTFKDGSRVDNLGASASQNLLRLNITSQGYFNNIAKLFLVMEQMDPDKFYNEYIKTGLIRSVSVVNRDISGTNKKVMNGAVNITTGYYVDQLDAAAATVCDIKNLQFRDSAVAWSIYTFLPYNFFANKIVIESNKIWDTIGIDNYAVIDSELAKVSVRHNIYTYNGDKSLTQELTNAGKISLNPATIDAFDYFKLTTGTISPAKAIQYLLKLSSTPYYNKKVIRILEIEPCKDFIWDGTKTAWDANDTNTSGVATPNGSSYARQFYAKFFPNYNESIIITTMTSMEYIGNIDDINTSYDMIFFGLRDGKLKSAGASSTDYNYNTLDGKIYLHNGDTIQMSDNRLRGLDDTNSSGGIDTFRFSGNDITNLKYAELIDFMKAGNPIILDQGFYDSTNKTAVNTAKIDSNSYIYSLANEITTAVRPSLYIDSLFSADGISINKLESKLIVNKCK